MNESLFAFAEKEEKLTGRHAEEWGIYVRNLPSSTQWWKLKKTFEEAFPDVVYADVSSGTNNRKRRDGKVSSTRWGTVRFASKESRDASIVEFNGRKMGRNKMEVTIDTRDHSGA